MSAITTLRALIETRARHYADKPFLIAAPDDGQAVPREGEVLTFAMLRERCRELEARFRGAGLRQGDVVSVFMGNGIQTATLLLAAMYSGLVAHPLNLLCQRSQLRYIVEHSDMRMVFVCDETADALAAARSELREQGVSREIAVV